MAARGKKKSKKGGAPPRPSELSMEELEQLRRGLGATDALSDRDFLALSRHLERDHDAASLQLLLEKETQKVRVKALKRALHHLGVQVRPKASVELTSLGPGEAFPMLMAVPEPDATRIFTFALPSGAVGVRVFEAYFCMPEGLYRLKSSPSTPAEYRLWVQEMVGKGRATMPKGMLDRKKWEIRQYARRGHVGKEFERNVADLLDWPSQEPAHPANGLDLDAVLPLDFGGLAKRKALVPFQHAKAMQTLQRDWDQAGGALITSPTDGNWLDGSVAEWAQQWGMEAITELCRDYAVYFARRGELGAARALRDAASGPDPEARSESILAFLKGFLKEDLT